MIIKGNTNLPPQGISTPTKPRQMPQRQQEVVGTLEPLHSYVTAT